MNCFLCSSFISSVFISISLNILSLFSLIECERMISHFKVKTFIDSPFPYSCCRVCLLLSQSVSLFSFWKVSAYFNKDMIMHHDTDSLSLLLTITACQQGQVQDFSAPFFDVLMCAYEMCTHSYACFVLFG